MCTSLCVWVLNLFITLNGKTLAVSPKLMFIVFDVKLLYKSKIS